MSYDQNLDDFTKQFLGDDPSTNVDKFVSRSKYSTNYRYINEADFKDIHYSIVEVLTDSVYGNKRKVSLSIIPQRKVNFFEIRPSYNEEKVIINMIFDNKFIPEFSLIETSFDLMTNSNFNFKPRSNIMMPMPFVTNDAIILSKNISL